MPQELKEGNVYTFQVPQSSTTYTVRLASTAKGLWMCIQQSYMQWKLTISEDLARQTIAKISGAKEQLTFKEFIAAVYAAVAREGERWSVGIMTPVELEMLRGGNASKQASNSKLYLILSDKTNKLHFPFTFILNDLCEKDKIIEAIKSMKDQLDEFRTSADKSQSSFSVMSESGVVGEQLKMQNEELKRKIKIYEESLTQKRGAVEIDNIFRERNNLELQAETKKRQEAKEITRLKNLHSLMDREIGELRNQVDLINKELLLLQDSLGNPAKLKSHALRVLKSYENDLRTSKKVLMKQTKDIEALRRNIATSKNNQKKQLTKIKQIEAEIEQAKKKTNIKEISNRLHSRNGASSQGGSLKAPSEASDDSNAKRGPNKIATNNLVRQNLLKRTGEIKNDRNQRSLSNTGEHKNPLLRTTPNIKSPSIPRKSQFKPPARPVASSHIINSRAPDKQSPMRPRSKQNDWNSNRSSSTEFKKKQFSPADKERQKAAIQRLAGGSRKPPLVASSSSKNITRTSNTKPPVTAGKKDNAKDILNRMKEVKAQYNNRSRNSAAKEQGIAAKVAELTSKKTME